LRVASPTRPSVAGRFAAQQRRPLAQGTRPNRTKPIRLQGEFHLTLTASCRPGGGSSRSRQSLASQTGGSRKHPLTSSNGQCSQPRTHTVKQPRSSLRLRPLELVHRFSGLRPSLQQVSEGLRCATRVVLRLPSGKRCCPHTAFGRLCRCIPPQPLAGLCETICENAYIVKRRMLTSPSEYTRCRA
jgi:hypothetical protein